MKRRYVVAGLGLLAAVALTSSALGGPSLNSLIKNEVAKQLSAAQVSKKGKRGPPGPQGPAGTNGTNGANGTARAYALVERFCSGGPPEACQFERAKGIASASRVSTGRYCVNAPGIDPSSEVAVVTVERDFSASPAGNASAIVNTDLSCSGAGGGFGVETYRQPSTTVRNAAGDGTTDVAGNAVLADDVSFMIVIP